MKFEKSVTPEPPPYGFTSEPAVPTQGYPAPNYQPQVQPAQNYIPQGYPAQTYAPQGYPSQNYVPAPPPPQPHPAPVVVMPAGGWFSRNQRNKPQSNAVGAASLIFISGGMNIAWSTGFRGVPYNTVSKDIRVAWFIGGIIGAALSGFLANKIPKKMVVQFSSALVIIGGIVLASTYYNPQALTAALYLDGIANGLVFAPFMALAGEVSVPYMRGMLSASIEQMCFYMGNFIQIVYSSCWTYSNVVYYDDFGAENVKGVLSIVYGVMALVIGTFLCIESPVIMLANGEEERAIDALRRLQRPYTVTNETYEQLAEHKRYLAQNKDLTVGQSVVQALPAFVRLSYLRALNAMSLSSVAITSLILSVWLRYEYGWYGGWFIGFGVARFCGHLIFCFCMDSLGRKKPTLFGLFVSGIMAIAVGTQVTALMDGIAIMLIVIQVFIGIAMTATSPYISEAYPLGVKQHFIAFTYIVEMLIFIIIGVCDYSSSGTTIYFYAFGGMLLFAFIAGIFTLPETKMTTLRESQEKFRGLCSRSF